MLLYDMVGSRHILRSKVLPMRFSMSRSLPRSREWIMAIDMPVFPARPVRPERWVYVATSSGKSVINDMSKVAHVEAACGYIGGDKYAQHMVAKFLHHHIALLLRELSVERVGIVAVLYEPVGNLLCLLTYGRTR